jgi:hypothetical protein
LYACADARSFVKTGWRLPYHCTAFEALFNGTEVDLAKNLLNAGMDQVENLKSKDTDNSNPNRALKAWWPSVSLISRLIWRRQGSHPKRRWM